MTAETLPHTETPDFGDAQAEYRAARDAAAVFDVSDRTQLEMTGADRHSFLHNFTTNNINALPAGRCCEALLCNVKGRILGHVFVFAGTETTWVDSVPCQGDFLTSHLERYHLLEDFTLTDRTAARGEFLVTGPQSAATLSAAGIDVTGVENLSCQTREVEFSGGPSLTLELRRMDVFGGPTYWLSGDQDDMTPLWNALTEAGAVASGRNAMQTLRIESAFPWYGIDLSDENLGQEACRTAQAISFEKGCYLGQEPIARIHAMGHVNRELRRFLIDSREQPAAGTALLNPADDSREIGRITSVAWSWEHDCPIGLGMVRTKFSKPGSQVTLATEPRLQARVVDDLPA